MFDNNFLNFAYFFDLTSFKHKKIFHEAENVWDVLKRIRSYLTSLTLGSIEAEVDPRAYLIDEHLISIGKGSIVEPGAYIKGPCVIGENCIIRHGAYIRGDFISGNECVIGHDTEVKNTIFLNRTQAAHFAYLGDSILGNYVNLGAGTKCANLRLDHKNVSIDWKGNKQDTGLRKFGAILGDHVQLGCNCVTNPGTLIGKHTLCHPCVNIGGFIPEKHIVKSGTHVMISQQL